MIPAEKSDEKNRGAIKKPPRKRFVIPFVIAALLFIVFSLPEGLVGQEVSVQDLVARIKMLERKMVRMVMLVEFKVPPKVTLCGVDIPVNRPDVRECFEQEFYIVLGNRATVVLWAKRSGRYFPYVEKRLKERNLPDDLKYLAIAESDLKPEAYSPAGASGIWQFMEGTGRHHGLRIDAHVDERRDFQQATDAALEFLSRLHSQFSDWLIAMAAYNAGPGRLADEMERQKVKSYFDLNLPRETERYIYRIAAIKTVLGNPEQYGVDLSQEEKYAPQDFDNVTVSVPVRSVGLIDVADAAGITYRQLTDMNPQLRQSTLPKGSHSLHLPKGSSTAFIIAWSEKFKGGAEPAKTSASPEKKKKTTYTVRKGDTLMSIARKHKCSADDIRKWNKLKQTGGLPAGKKLVIYK